MRKRTTPHGPGRECPGAGSGMRAQAAILAALLVCSAASCSFDYGGGAPSGTEAPSAVFSGYVRSEMTKGAKTFEVRAGRAEYYDRERVIRLQDISFREFDPETGTVKSEGTAERVLYRTDTGDAEMTGRIRMASTAEDAVFETTYLRYNDAAGTLEGKPDGVVMVRIGSGSWIRGAGFMADIAARSFALREGVEGRMGETADEGEQ